MFTCYKKVVNRCAIFICKILSAVSFCVKTVFPICVCFLGFFLFVFFCFARNVVLIFFYDQVVKFSVFMINFDNS